MRYVLILEADSRRGDPKGTRRLRAMLKRLLRSWGFKCIEAKPIDEAKEKPQ